MFITASKDNYAKLFDTESMQIIKEYKTDRPVNSASVSPIRDQVRFIFNSNKQILIVSGQKDIPF